MKTLSDHILDIIQNSVRAGATLIEIMVEENKIHDICILKISDNGCGMDEKMVEQATKPFFTTRNSRKVGLGLSLLKQNAERANGKLIITSELNKGTAIKAFFQYSNVDRPETGDIWNTLFLTMLSNENLELIYEHKTSTGSFKFSSTEIKENIEGVSMHNAEIRNAVIDFIKSNIKNIQ